MVMAILAWGACGPAKAAAPVGDPASGGTVGLSAPVSLSKNDTGENAPSTVRHGSVTFENDIQPLLTRFGCNSGPCHGKSRGQNGFALSLLGFDADFDHHALVRAARGRRISLASPDRSLLLRKATAAVPHGGGARFAEGSPPYELLRDWIAAGTPRTPDDAPQLLRVEVRPPRCRLAPHQQLPLQVVAEYSDGSQRDVTGAAAFQSNDQTIAAVSAAGDLTAGPLPGEAAVMIRYMNHIAVCSVAIPLSGDVPAELYDRLPRENRLDALVWDKLKLLGMLPSPETDDATFLRRAHLRAIGRLPTPDQTRAFLQSDDPQKRAALVDHLLAQPEYADFWANKWTDLLRPNPYRVGMKAVKTLDAWIRDAFRRNMPYDQFVRELVTARGSTWRNGATVIFRDRPETVEIASSVSQLFLGVRLECAKCHHHPFELWSQDDFFGFAAFFARVGHHGGLSPPISGGEELIFAKTSGELNHGRTGEAVAPKTLLGQPLTIDAQVDPRDLLADWITAPDNPFFARVMANRVWAELMGQGFVEPVDDLRVTNPATNDPLLQYLADDFRDHGFDIKHLIGTIMKSRVFGLSSVPGERNMTDTRNFSRYYRQRLRAEVLLDAVSDLLEVPEEFSAMPPGSRATQLWTHRSSSLFLDTFGRPDPNQDPPCERTSESTTPQILHMMNSPELNRKLALDNARPARLAASDWSNEQIVEEIYLMLFCRPPSDDERKTAVAIFPVVDGAGSDAGPAGDEKVDGDAVGPTAPGGLTGEEFAAQRRAAVADLFWALLNTPEFLFIN
jgi:hypothetical protein